MKESEVLITLLQKALPSPSCLDVDPDGCSLIVLACHCLMVQDGFNPVLTEGRSTMNRSAYTPPPSWNANMDRGFWEIVYSKEGMPSHFVLRVSFHAPTRRVYINVSEADANLRNRQELGLNLEKYLPDPAVLTSGKDWADCVSPAACERLTRYWAEHFAAPLNANARRIVPPERRSVRRGQGYWGPREEGSAAWGPMSGTSPTGTVLALTAAAVAVAAGGMVLMRSVNTRDAH